MKIYTQETQDKKARAGLINLNNIIIPTPIFMPVGTRATVKAITVMDLLKINYSMILSNTYHLSLRPGDKVIAKMGGLHQFMNWKRLILTDSGGFQIFSLQHLRKITKEGVTFRNHLDGSKHFLTPEKVVSIQKNLGSDIMMVLDECLSPESSYDKTAASSDLTINWAKRSLKAHKEKSSHKNQELFAIVQGGFFEELRKNCLQELEELDFAGYAIGGLSVGESKEDMYRILNYITPLLPKEKPRYLMGVGHPIDILEAVASGVDMMDSVMPTRNARNGSFLTRKGWLNIKRKEFLEDKNPIDEECSCHVCKNYTRSYLRHLFQSSEILLSQLGSYHNLFFLKQMMTEARQAILEKRFLEYKNNFCKKFLS